LKKAPITKTALNSNLYYGSDLRNKSIYAEALVENGKANEALPIIKQIEKELNSTGYYNTLGIGQALKVLQRFYSSGTKSNIKMDYVWNGAKETVTSGNGYISELAVKNANKQSLTVINNGSANLYFSIITSGKDPISTDRPVVNNNVNLAVKYTDISGSPLDITNIKQGTSFIATFDISSTGTVKSNLDNMALNFIVPAGWEINNDRLANIDNYNNGIQFQQILDDRVHSFFSLNNRRVVVKIPLTATYAGSYYFPSIRCESMYNKDVIASTSPSRVNVLSSMNAMQ
jgi:alpha-2-macroglobulin